MGEVWGLAATIIKKLFEYNDCCSHPGIRIETLYEEKGFDNKVRRELFEEVIAGMDNHDCPVHATNEDGQIYLWIESKEATSRFGRSLRYNEVDLLEHAEESEWFDHSSER